MGESGGNTTIKAPNILKEKGMRFRENRHKTKHVKLNPSINSFSSQP